MAYNKGTISESALTMPFANGMVSALPEMVPLLCTFFLLSTFPLIHLNCRSKKIFGHLLIIMYKETVRCPREETILHHHGWVWLPRQLVALDGEWRGRQQWVPGRRPVHTRTLGSVSHGLQILRIYHLFTSYGRYLSLHWRDIAHTVKCVRTSSTNRTVFVQRPSSIGCGTLRFTPADDKHFVKGK